MVALVVVETALQAGLGREPSSEATTKEFVLQGGAGEDATGETEPETAHFTLSSTLTGHPTYVFSVAFSPDGSLLASGGVNAVKLWTRAGDEW